MRKIQFIQMALWIFLIHGLALNAQAQAVLSYAPPLTGPTYVAMGNTTPQLYYLTTNATGIFDLGQYYLSWSMYDSHNNKVKSGIFNAPCIPGGGQGGDVTCNNIYTEGNFYWANRLEINFAQLGYTTPGLFRIDFQWVHGMPVYNGPVYWVPPAHGEGGEGEGESPYDDPNDPEYGGGGFEEGGEERGSTPAKYLTPPPVNQTFSPYSIYISYGVFAGNVNLCGAFGSFVDTYGALVATGTISTGACFAPPRSSGPQGLIFGGSTVQVIAGNSVILNPGFEVQALLATTVYPQGYTTPAHIVTPQATVDDYVFKAYTANFATLANAKQDIQNTASNATDASDVSVYPNPALGSFTVNTASYTGNTGTVELLNVYGQSLQKVIDNTNIPSSCLIDTEQLQAGTYLVKITANKKTTVKRVVIVD